MFSQAEAIDSAPSPRYAIMLNNVLQETQDVKFLSMVESSTGPDHEPTWTVTYKFKGLTMGVGVARQKWKAKDMAAHATLRILGHNV